MSGTLTKICGITSPEDAVMCRGLGADLLGVIFAESARKVTPKRALETREAVPDAVLVGVFSGGATDEVRRVAEVCGVAEACGLDMVQLHGAETPEFVRALALSAGVPVIKALVGVGAGGQAVGASARSRLPASSTLERYEAARFFLFDMEKAVRGDDVGMAALWEEAAAASAAGHRVFLAGGLTAGNVGAAVARVRPYCADVCRGVETAPGVKDPAAVERFIAEVRK